MADTRIDIETDRRGLSRDVVCSMTPSEMRRIVGGRSWDALLGGRDGCPPKPSSKPLLIVAEDIAGSWDGL